MSASFNAVNFGMDEDIIQKEKQLEMVLKIQLPQRRINYVLCIYSILKSF